MAEKVLTYTVKVDGKDVEKSLDNIENYNERILQLRKDIESTPIGSDKYKELQGTLTDVEGAFSTAKIKAGGFGDAMAEQPGIIGSLGKSFQGLKGGIKTVGVAMKALALNPLMLAITVLVGAVVGLYKAFASTKKGAELISKVFAGISAGLDVLRDRVVKVGGAIIKFFSGDFSGAFNDVSEAVSGIGDEIAAEMKIAMDATKRLQDVEDEMRKLNVSRAKQNALIAEAKGKINDENLSYKEREAALEEVRVAEVALAQQEEKLAKERYNALKALADLSDSSKEQLDELAAAEIEMYNRQKETAEKIKDIGDQQKALRDKRKAEEKKNIEDRAAAEKEYVSILQDLNLEQIQDVREREAKKLEIEKQSQINKINSLKISEEKKNQLLLELDESFLLRKQALEDGFAKEDEDKKLDTKKKDEETAQGKRDLLMRDLEAQLGLLGMAEDLNTELIEEKLRERLEMLLENDELTANERLILMAETEENIIAVKTTAAEQEEALDRQKVAVKQQALSDIVTIFGAETAVGKAALVAKQLINAKELIMEISKTINFATQASSRAGIAIAGGVAETAKIGFPQNIPMLIGYAAQAAGIIMAIKSAVSSAKSGGGGSGGSNPGTTGAGFASGGMVTGPGTGTSDSVPVRLSRGESVINARSTKMFSGMLSNMNQMGGGRKFASGGVVGNNSLSTMNMLSSQQPSQQMGPIKTYVVASDVESMNQMERVAKTNSSI